MEKVKLPTRIRMVAIVLTVMGCFLHIVSTPMCGYSSSDYLFLVLVFSCVFFGVLLLRRIKWAWHGTIVSIIGMLFVGIIVFIKIFSAGGFFHAITILFILPQLIFLIWLFLDRKKYLEVASLEISPKRKKVNILIAVGLLTIFATYSIPLVLDSGCSRTKAKQAAIKSGLKNIQVQSEFYYNDNKQYYTENSTRCDVGMFTDPTIEKALAWATRSGNGISMCSITRNGQAWAVSIPFVFPKSSGSFCVDSEGRATSTTINPATGLCFE